MIIHTPITLHLGSAGRHESLVAGGGTPSTGLIIPPSWSLWSWVIWETCMAWKRWKQIACSILHIAFGCLFSNHILCRFAMFYIALLVFVANLTVGSGCIFAGRCAMCPPAFIESGFRGRCSFLRHRTLEFGVVYQDRMYTRWCLCGRRTIRQFFGVSVCMGMEYSVNLHFVSDSGRVLCVSSGSWRYLCVAEGALGGLCFANFRSCPSQQEGHIVDKGAL